MTLLDFVRQRLGEEQVFTGHRLSRFASNKLAVSATFEAANASPIFVS